MKLTNFFIVRALTLTAFFLAICSCKPEVLEEEHLLSIVSPSEETVTIPAEGGEFTIEIRSNLSWSVSAMSDGAAVKWITFDKSKGTADAVVTATVSKGTVEERSATVFIRSLDEKLEKSITVLQGASDGPPEAEGYSFPAYDIFENVSDSDLTLGLKNAVLEGAGCIFEKGASLTMGGATSTVTLNSPNYYQINARFDGWGADDASEIVMKIPSKEALAGDYRMFWGWTSSTESSWSIAVGNNGTDYVETGITLSMSSGSRFNRDVFFTIPQSAAVPAGGTLYIRLKLQSTLGADDYVQFCTGFLLTKATVEGAELPITDKTLYSCDFNAVNIGCPYDMPLGYLRSSSVAFDPAAYGYDGMSKTGTVAGEWGSVRIGSASGAASLTLPALGTAKLGEGTADVKVSFKAVLYQAATILSETQGKASCQIGVSVAEGDGTVENGTITDIENWESFTEKSVVVKGVSKNTRINIGIAGGSGDRRFYLDDIIIDAISEIVVPSETAKTLTEVLEMADGTISESIKTTVTVISDHSGGNMPSDLAAITDGTSYGALKIQNASSLAAGSQLTISLSGAKKAGKVLEIESAMIKETETGSVPAPAKVKINELDKNEYKLVVVDNIQATDSFVGKTYVGDILMEDGEKATGTMSVLEGASFASGVIPANSGSVTGIVIGGKIYPRTASDINLILDRMGQGAPEAFKTIFCTYENSTATSGTTADVQNVTISGMTATFTNGGSIEKIGGTEGTMSFAQAKDSFYNVYLTSTGWDAEGTHYVLSCPTEEEISGKVAVTFSLNGKTEVQQTWKIWWSNDGQNWKETEYTWNTVNNTDEKASAAKNTFTGQSTTSKGITRTEFTIPAASKISAGGKLYIKLEPEKTIATASTAVQIGMGFVVADGDYVNTDEPAGAILFNNFAECLAGTDYMLGAELRYFGNVATPTYEKDGWTVKNGSERIGYTMYGTASSGDHGITTPALTSISGTKDVTVTFKCCLYMPSTLKSASDDVCVKVAEGSGEVGELTWDTELASDYYVWHTATVTIKGASTDTRIFIGAGAGKVTSGDRRFFLDDICVK